MGIYVEPPLFEEFEETFYPDKHPEEFSVDGRVIRRTNISSWLNLRDGAGTSAYDDDAFSYIGFSFGWRRSTIAILRRLIVLFDTTIIPIRAIILAGRLTLNAWVWKEAAYMLPAINVYTAFPLSNTELVPADYQNVGSTPLSTKIEYDDWRLAKPNKFPLNDDGLKAIIQGGITKLAVREANYDAPNIEPIPLFNINGGFEIVMADYGNALGPSLWVKWRV